MYCTHSLSLSAAQLMTFLCQLLLTLFASILLSSLKYKGREWSCLSQEYPNTHTFISCVFLAFFAFLQYFYSVMTRPYISSQLFCLFLHRELDYFELI